MEIVIKPKKRLVSFKEFFEYKELIYFLAWRDIKVKYKQTIIGITWAVIQPFLTMVVFTLFFNKVVGITSGNTPYVLFSYSGLIFWNYFSTSLNEEANSLISNQSIVTKVFFPRLIIPVSATIVGLMDFIFAFVVLIIMMFFYRIPVNFLYLLGIIPLIVLTFITINSLGIFLSIINVKYRDVRYALPFFIQLMLFLTPVIYPVSLIPGKFQWIIYLNPMTGIIEAARFILISHGSINILGLCISIMMSFILLFTSLFYFNANEGQIADII